MYISNVWLQLIYFYFVMKENGLHVKIWNLSWAKGFLEKLDLIWDLRFFGSRLRIQISMWSPFCGCKSKANHLLKIVKSIFNYHVSIDYRYSNFLKYTSRSPYVVLSLYFLHGIYILQVHVEFIFQLLSWTNLE